MDSERQSCFDSPRKSRTVNRWSKHDRYFLQLIKLHASSEVLRRWEILVVFPLPSVCPRVMPQILGQKCQIPALWVEFPMLFKGKQKPKSGISKLWLHVDVPQRIPEVGALSFTMTNQNSKKKGRNHLCFQVFMICPLFFVGFFPLKTPSPNGSPRTPTPNTRPPRIVRSKSSPPSLSVVQGAAAAKVQVMRMQLRWPQQTWTRYMLF